jgi:hypothetical protein
MQSKRRRARPPAKIPSSVAFPPFPVGLKGRRQELTTLARMVRTVPHARLALVGGGGSGKSMLACALGYRVKSSFPGGIHWFRSGPWDTRTLAEMLAIRFGSPRERPRLFRSLRDTFARRGPTLVVLDNHENDRAVALLLNELDGAPVTWLVTARRCLLGGLYVFPVVAPLATSGKIAFPRVHSLATLLRHSPLALSIADGLVRSGAVRVDALRAWLLERGVDRVRVIAHEDDLPEVALLVEWAWPKLTLEERRILAVLAYVEGDHMDAGSVCSLARVAGGAKNERPLARLRAWNLVQRPLPSRYALHAVVRYAVARRTRFEPGRILEHYIELLERHPDRLDLEQTHLYAAMDYAQGRSDVSFILRVGRLTASLADVVHLGDE